MPREIAHNEHPIRLGICQELDGVSQTTPQEPHNDGITHLKGDCAFVMEMEDGEKVVSEVEKGSKLATKAKNLCLHLKGGTSEESLHMTSSKYL